MAKGAMLSVKRGKLGDAVGYNVSNSNTKERQGWRIYQPVVKNPQTDAQLAQRVKLAAVNNIYRALKEVIRRGFEGQEYGDPSRRAWLKMALGQSFDGPWLVKGSQTPVPIKNVPLTVGSMPPVSVTYDTDDGYMYTNITSDSALAGSETVADISQLFINAGYQEGDQVTVITGWVPLRLAFAWDVRSFILSLTDTRTMQSLGFTIDSTQQVSVGNKFALCIDSRGGSPDALAIAVSRDGDGSHLRSTSYIATNPFTVDAVYYGTQMYAMAIRSYQKTAAESTDWPIQPNRAGGSTYVTKAADGTTVTLVSTSMTDGYVVVVSDTGEEYYVKCTDTYNSAYNQWLIAKTGSSNAEVWTSTAPADPVPSDSYVAFDAGRAATADTLQLFYFLLSQGFDARALLAQLS